MFIGLETKSVEKKKRREIKEREEWYMILCACVSEYTCHRLKGI